MAEWVGSRAINQKVVAVPNDVVSLGKALHPTRRMSLYLLLVALDKSVCLMTECTTSAMGPTWSPEHEAHNKAPCSTVECHTPATLAEPALYAG